MDSPSRFVERYLRADAIELAMIYGSIANGSAKAVSDIDLLIISDELTLEEVFALVDKAPVGRAIHPTLYAREEFDKRRKTGSAFVTRILEGKNTVLIGSVPDE